MATDFIMPRVPTSSQDHFFQHLSQQLPQQQQQQQELQQHQLQQQLQQQQLQQQQLQQQQLQQQQLQQQQLQLQLQLQQQKTQQQLPPQPYQHSPSNLPALHANTSSASSSASASSTAVQTVSTPFVSQYHPQISPLSTSNSTPFVSQYHPQVSPLSTSNSGSPTSPKASAYHSRQARPLYIPAVLRPTEYPSREVPATPRKRRRAGGAGGAVGSTGGNAGAGGVGGIGSALARTAAAGDPVEGEDGGEDADDDVEDNGEEETLRSSGSFISLPGLGAALGIGRLSRRSTNDSGKCMDTDTWNLDLFPQVNAPPSRDHWKPDPESTMCDEPTCKRFFNYFTRRHHCRRCGNIFCDLHSSFEIPLDENANYNPRGLSSRACAYCFREFKAWRTRTNSSDLSNGSSTPNNNEGGAKSASASDSAGRTATGKLSRAVTAPTSPVMALTGRPGAPGTPTMAKAPDVAKSVPGDWNWSTF